MKIKSNFSDCYDGFLAYGQENLTFHRVAKDKEVFPLPFSPKRQCTFLPLKELNNIDLLGMGEYKGYLPFRNFGSYDENTTKEAFFLNLLLVGNSIFALKTGAVAINQSTQVNSVKVKELDLQNPWQDCYQFYFLPLNKNYWANKENNLKTGFDELIAALKEVQVKEFNPVVMGVVGFSYETKKIALLPVVNFKIDTFLENVNPEYIYQQINQWFIETTNPDEKRVEIEDKYKIGQHGFNEKSFRKTSE